MLLKVRQRRGKEVNVQPHCSRPSCHATPQSCLWTETIPLLPLPILSLPQVVAWYDNEWGYSQRVVDLAEITATKWE